MGIGNYELRVTDYELASRGAFGVWGFLGVLMVVGGVCFGQYSGGSGTVGEPYLISSAGDLVLLGNSEGDWGKHFVLVNDIDLAGVTVKPIGYSSTYRFDGSFDGGGHVIRNLTIDLPEVNYVGLFGRTSEGCQILNLGLEEYNVTGKYYVGGLVGYNRNGEITNCYSMGSVTGSYDVGGLVGENRIGTITDCCSMGLASGDRDVGGMVGGDYWGTITGCYSMGSVSAGGNAGGMVWDCYAGTVDKCFSLSAVNGGSYVGGLVGSLWKGTIRNCFSTGAVSGDDVVGGFAGRSQYATMSNCYSTGSVSGNTGIGGFVGNNRGGVTISSCYFLESSGANNGNGEALAEEKMRKRAIFAGWDFFGEDSDRSNDAWKMIEAVTMPLLLWDKRVVHVIQGHGGEEPGADVMRFYNMSEDEVSWHIDTEGIPDWLEILSNSGMVAGGSYADVPVSFSTGELAIGIYSHSFAVYDSSTMEVIDVTGVLVEVAGPILEVSEEKVEFAVSENGDNPAMQILGISNAGGGMLEWGIVSAETCSWLEIEPVGGVLGPGESAEVVVSVDTGGLGVGFYSCTLDVSAGGAQNSPRAVPVIVRVGGICVALDGSEEFDRIQEAIDAAVDGDEVIVWPGRYRESIEFKGKEIVVRSVSGDWSGVAETSIEGQGEASSYRWRPVMFSGSEGANCQLRGFTIFGGFECGIYGNGTEASISHCHVRNNRGTALGGIYDVDGVIENCVIANNVAGDSGGGLAKCDGTVRNCTIVNNRAADHGGGLFDCRGVIENCIVFGNEPEYDSGMSVSSIPRFSCYPYASGEGNIDVDPLFSDAGYWAPDPNDPSGEVWVRDYHLKSAAGRWDGVAGAWVYDDVTSLCIDAGDPLDGWCGEYWPHGGRVNMGAYGGGREASMSLSTYGSAGDLDCDGGVGFYDFGLFADDWGYGGESGHSVGQGPPYRSDFDRDGVVGIGDLARFAEEWIGN